MKATIEVLGDATKAKAEAKRRGLKATWKQTIPANPFLQGLGIAHATELIVSGVEKPEATASLVEWYRSSGDAFRENPDEPRVGFVVFAQFFTDRMVPTRAPCLECAHVLDNATGNGHAPTCSHATSADRAAATKATIPDGI